MNGKVSMQDIEYNTQVRNNRDGVFMENFSNIVHFCCGY